MSKETERILKLKEDMSDKQWFSSQLRLNLEREEGRIEEREKILELIKTWETTDFGTDDRRYLAMQELKKEISLKSGGAKK